MLHIIETGSGIISQPGVTGKSTYGLPIQLPAVGTASTPAYEVLANAYAGGGSTTSATKRSHIKGGKTYYCIGDTCSSLPLPPPDYRYWPGRKGINMSGTVYPPGFAELYDYPIDTPYTKKDEKSLLSGASAYAYPQIVQESLKFWAVWPTPKHGQDAYNQHTAAMKQWLQLAKGAAELGLQTEADRAQIAANNAALAELSKGWTQDDWDLYYLERGRWTTSSAEKYGLQLEEEKRRREEEAKRQNSLIGQIPGGWLTVALGGIVLIKLARG